MSGAIMQIEREFKREEIKDEFKVWVQLVKPELALPANVTGVCEYGFTEVLNNVIDHSDCQHVSIKASQSATETKLEISDDGIGIFARLCAYFHFDSEIHALIELVKGKLTVAPSAHSGEGLFFSSKMFDEFSIESGSLSVTFTKNECHVKSISARKGTRISMSIENNSLTTAKEVFNLFCDANEMTFYKTRFFLSLAELEGSLISRSQAKRVAARFDSFSEVELNFTGIENIGQAFADELLRVWPLNHPNTQLQVSNANESVSKMVSHIQSRLDLPQPNTNVSPQ